MQIEKDGNEIVLVGDFDNVIIDSQDWRFLKELPLSGIWTEYDEKGRIRLALVDENEWGNRRRILAFFDYVKDYGLALSDDVCEFLESRLLEAKEWVDRFEKNYVPAPKKEEHGMIIMRVYTQGYPGAEYHKYYK